MMLFVSPNPLRPLTARTAVLPRSVNRRRPASRRNAPAIFARQSTGSSESKSPGEDLSLPEKLRLLVDPTLNTSARQVLTIDILGEVPKIISSTLKTSNSSSSSNATSSKRDNGLDDVTRQLREDIIPDLVNNGPQYVARTLETITSPPNASSAGQSIPTPNIPQVQLSPEEVTQEVQNVFKSTPDGLYTPDYEVLLSEDGYEVRRYPSLILAQTKMTSDSSDGTTKELDYATAMGSSFGNLASYLFGKNESSSAMKMTTPVVMDMSRSAPATDSETAQDGSTATDTGGSAGEMMSFIIGEYQNVSDVPVPEDGSVQVVEVPGGVFAAAEFSGYVTKGEARRQSDRIVDLVQKSQKVRLASESQPDFKFLVYNPPYTLPNLRRNEVLVAVDLEVAEESEGITDA